MDDKELYKHVLGEWISRNRMSKGFSQDELAEAIDINAKYMSNIEVGKQCPSSYTLTRIQLVLGLDANEMLQEFEEKRSN